VDRLDEIKARIEKATLGPWHADTAVRGDCVVWGPMEDQFLANIGNAVSRVMLDGQHEEQAERVAFDMEAANCELIAHSRADLEWAVAEIEKLRREADESEERHQEEISEAMAEARAGEDW
jgi:hypothetical protein